MKSLETALGVLKVFVDADGELSVQDIVEKVGLKKSHVSKILSTLRQAGMLEQNPKTRHYSVGVEAFELGTRYLVRQQLARDALPIMRQLVDRCGHSATLSIRRGGHVLHLMAVEGPLYIDGRWRVGNRLPIHATSAGRVLLAWMEEDEAKVLLAQLDLDPITPQTITDADALLERIAETRKSGLAITRGESAPGLAAIAVPVFDAEDKVDAALGLVIPDQHFDDADQVALQEELFGAARRLSLKLGAAAYPFGGATSAKDGTAPKRRKPPGRLQAVSS